MALPINEDLTSSSLTSAAEALAVGNADAFCEITDDADGVVLLQVVNPNSTNYVTIAQFCGNGKHAHTIVAGSATPTYRFKAVTGFSGTAAVWLGQ